MYNIVWYEHQFDHELREIFASALHIKIAVYIHYQIRVSNGHLSWIPLIYISNINALLITSNWLQISFIENSSDDRHESWSQSVSKNLLKLQASALPTQLPARADKPSCTGMHVMFHTKYNYFVNNASKISIPRFCFFPFFFIVS